MTALVVLTMFAVFITLDWVLIRRSERQAAAAEASGTISAEVSPAPAPVSEPELLLDPVFVAGYELPEPLHYHRGHTWVRVLGPDMVAVGIDDFARRLIGRAKSLRLPDVGTWLTQGASSCGVDTEGRSVDMLSPVAGRVCEVNPDLDDRPATATEDPYRRGWLFKVQSPDLVYSLRNLFSGRLARKWIEDAREQLDLRLMALSGSVLQDGGDPAQDFGDHLAHEDWAHLVGSFLLTEAHHD